MAIIASIISAFDSKGFDEAAKKTLSTQQKFDKFAKKAAVAFAGVSAAIFAFGKEAAQDAADAQRLAITLQNVTGATEGSIAAVEEYISKLTIASGVADTDLRASLNRLVLSTKDVTEAQQLQALALDLSIGTGKDLTTTTKALALAYEGNFAPLKKMGVSIDETTLKSKDFSKVGQQLQKDFGGQFQSYLTTDAAKMAILDNSFSEAKETIGYAFLPILTSVTGAFQALVPFIEDNSEAIAKITLVVGALAGAITIINLAVKAWQATVAAAAAIQAVWNAVLLANPIGLIIAAIAAIIAIFVLLYNKVEWVREAWDTAFEAIRGAVEAAFNWIKDNWQTVAAILLGPIALAVKMIIDNFDKIKAVAKKIFNSIADLWNSTVGKVSFTLPDWVPVIGGKGFDMPNIPKLADGGIVTKPTLALIGEAGAEAVIPLSRGRGMGSSYTININSALADPEGVARAIKQVIQDSERRAGAYLVS